MTTINIDDSHDFDSNKYLLASEIADLMTKQFNETEINNIFPYFQTGGTNNVKPVTGKVIGNPEPDYKKNDNPAPPPKPGMTKEEYDKANAAKHPEKYQEIKENNIPYKYNTYRTKKQETIPMYKMNLVKYLNAILDNLDKFTPKSRNMIVDKMRVLINDTILNKTEFQLVNRIIDEGNNYDIIKNVETSLGKQFKLEDILENSSIGNISMTAGQEETDDIENFILKELDEFQTVNNLANTSIQDNLLNQVNQLKSQLEDTQEENNRLKQELNYSSKQPQSTQMPQQESQPAQIPQQESQSAQIPLQKPKPTQMLQQEPQPKDTNSDNLFDKKETDGQKKMSKLFNLLKSQYNINIDSTTITNELKKVGDLTSDEFTQYYNEYKEMIKKTYKETIENYKNEIQSLLNTYNSSDLSSYRKLIEQLKNEKKSINYIKKEIKNMIVKQLEKESLQLENKFIKGKDTELLNKLRKKKQEIYKKLQNDNYNVLTFPEDPSFTAQLEEGLYNS